MNPPCLAYRRDAATGLPKLESFGIPLQENEAQSLEREITCLFEWLVQRGDGSTIAFETPLPKLGGGVRFDVTKVGKGRCPDLLFSPTDATSTGPSPAASTKATPTQANPQSPPLDWRHDFLKTVDGITATNPPDPLARAERASLEFVTAELRRLATDKPQELAPVLLAGYFLLGEKMCRKFDRRQIGFYRLASQALDALFQKKLQTEDRNSIRESAD